MVAFALTLLGVGCRPGVGGRCEKGEARCLDAARALIYENSAVIEVPCRGPKGCIASDTATACDIARSKVGDRCSRDEEGSATCADAHTLLACHGGNFVAGPCRGPRGCTMEGDRAVCDTTVGAPGESCREDGKKACSSEGASVLVCKGKVLAPLFTCRGPRGCSAAPGKLDCDMSVAMLGDACDPRLEGHIACAADGAGTLICKGGHFVHDETCKPKTSCVTEGNETRCSPKK